MRDKLISLRVNSQLVKRFESVVKSKTQVTTYAGRNHYTYKGQSAYWGGGKYTLADLLEAALEKYIAENK